MVIPIGGMGPPLMGPPPPQCARRFWQLKICVLATILFLFLKMVGGALLGGLALVAGILFDAANTILNMLMGVWLMKDDADIGKIYDFLATTCCATCAECCQGGMTCLLPFIICNLVTVLLQTLALVIGNNLMSNAIILWDRSRAGPNHLIADLAMWLFTMSFAGHVCAQAVATCLAWDAYKQARALEDEAGWRSAGADWAYPPAALRGAAAARPSGPGLQMSSYRRPDAEDGRLPAASAPPLPGGGGGGGAFQAFSGQGHRLGS